MAEINVADLGDQVKDSVSGFEGIVMAKHIYLNGCDRLSVQPKVGSDGKLPESMTFDIMQLKVVKRGFVKTFSKDTGGPEKFKPTARAEGKR